MKKTQRLQALPVSCLLLMLPWASPAASDTGLTFHLPFEEGIVASVAGGDPQPIAEGKHRSSPGQTVAGIKGQAIRPR